MLTGNEIKKQIDIGNIVIKPFDESQMNPNFYDLRLDNILRCYECYELDSKNKENGTYEIQISEDGYDLKPFELYLAQTIEWTETNNFIPIINGRSSIGRLGLFVHVTAGFGDIGFKGRWTLELMPTVLLRIYPKMKIAQIYYHRADGEISATYTGKYQGQTKPTASRIGLEL